MSCVGRVFFFGCGLKVNMFLNLEGSFRKEILDCWMEWLYDFFWFFFCGDVIIGLLGFDVIFVLKFFIIDVYFIDGERGYCDNCFNIECFFLEKFVFFVFEVDGLFVIVFCWGNFWVKLFILFCFGFCWVLILLIFDFELFVLNVYFLLFDCIVFILK